MAVENGDQKSAPAGRRSTLEPTLNADGTGSTSPLRYVFVIVPFLVLLATVTNLVGLWSFPAQQAARDEWREQQAASRPDDAPLETPPPAEIFPPEPQEPVAPTPSAPEAVMPKPKKPPPAGPAEPPAFDAASIVARLGSADAGQGAVTFRICSICHNAAEGEGHKIGPNLWGVVGREIAAEPDFRYSQSLRARGGTWSYEELAAFLHAPRQHTPGTSMAFRGIDDSTKLANILAHLRTLSDNPRPLLAASLLLTAAMA